MRLRHQKFESVDEVNEAIAPLLVQLNNKPFQKLPGVPRQCLCPDRRTGPAPLANADLGVGCVQDGQGSHRPAHRI